MPQKKPPTPPPVSVESLPPDEWTVPPELQGAFLDRVVRARYPEQSWNRLRSWIAQGKFSLDDQIIEAPTFTVSAASRVRFHPNGRKRGASSNQSSWIVFRDSQLVVVDKPAGIATVPFEGSEKDSLDRRVAALLGNKGRGAALHVVHRLDKETSGLLVFARTETALRHLKNQFRFHTTHRKYKALVHGHAVSRTIQSRLVQDRGDGLRGSTAHKDLGREAITHVRLLETFEGASFIECQLETGRTHQIRIHLAEQAHPLLGERVYSKGFTGELLPAPRILLHAAELGFDHPITGERLHFEKPLPEDFEAALQEFRAKSPVRGAPRTRPVAPRAATSRHGSVQESQLNRASERPRPASRGSDWGKRRPTPAPRTSGRR